MKKEKPAIYQLASIIRMRRSHGFEFEGSIAKEYLHKVGPPYNPSRESTDYSIDINTNNTVRCKHGL